MNRFEFHAGDLVESLMGDGYGVVLGYAPKEVAFKYEVYVFWKKDKYFFKEGTLKMSDYEKIPKQYHKIAKLAKVLFG